MNASVSDSEKDVMALAAEAAPRSSGAIVSEGVLAGFVAASAVALVFLVIDMAAGAAFRTPRQLGTMLLSLLGAGDSSGDMATSLAMYTLFHFIAFIVAGIIAAAIVQLTMKQPIAILLFVILFFAFEVIFTGFVAFLDVTSTSSVTPWQVAIGNVVASIAMALFFAARHPRLLKLGSALAADE
jgi:hypothetical protein